MADKTLSPSVQQFDTLPATALININDTCAITGRSRASIYRHFNAGALTLVKIGSSSRIRVADVRNLIGAAA